MIPRFAVVGHPNKGKSSIVATLAEDHRVAISNIPGTTTKQRSYPFKIDGETLYELIDTPGFQRPRQALSWLSKHSDGAQQRAHAVRQFVETHRDDARFHDECELLEPVLGGAGILYVVDGSQAYGKEYEAEMEILRWTGQPRMALINLIGADDHVDEWRRALDQYFSIVRVFDAVHADRDKRLALLRSFGELDPNWQDGIDRALNALENDFARRERRAAQILGELVCQALNARHVEYLAHDEEPDAVVAKLEEKLRDELRNLEQHARRQVENLYRHIDIQRDEQKLGGVDHDLFSTESAELFGLSRGQLVTVGAMSGAVAGSSIDVLLGGASLLAGAALGAVIGGIGAAFGSDRVAKLKVLGQSLASKKITVGPFSDPNLPWILLGRGLAHHEIVRERNHARRESLVVEMDASRYRADQIEESSRKALVRLLADLKRHEQLRPSPELVEEITRLMRRYSA